jgi:hypothetical protein
MIKYMIAYHVCLEPPRRTPAAKGIVNLRFNSPFISWDGAIPANIENPSPGRRAPRRACIVISAIEPGFSPLKGRRRAGF